MVVLVPQVYNIKRGDLLASKKPNTTKTPAKKTTTKKKPTATKKTAVNSAERIKHYKIKYELKMIGLVALTLFILISIYTGAGGVVGTWFSDGFLGLFSYVGYIMPIVIFGIIFVNLNPNFRPARLRITFAFLLFIIGLSILTTLLLAPGISKELLLATDDFMSLDQIKTYYSSGINLESGGVLGAVITIAISKTIGFIGAYIIIAVSFLASFIIFTRISIQELWEYRKKHKDERKASKREEQAIVESLITEASTEKKGRPTSDNSSPNFLSSLEAMRKASRKKDIQPFDYDTYEKKETQSQEHGKGIPEIVKQAEPVPETKPIEKKVNPQTQDIQYFDHEAKQVEKLKEKDIEPETRQQVNAEIAINVKKSLESYVLPPLKILNHQPQSMKVEDKSEYIEMAKLLEETLNNFNVDAKVISVKRGPSITMFEVQPSPGVKVSKIVGLSDDIALNLATSQVRIAPIPGKAAIGIEVPNKITSMVTFREVITSSEFKKQTSKLTIGLGKDISGNPIIGDLSSMPHLLIAGATGSGKSVCVNTIISSILFNAKPDEVKFLMIDPKVVELSNYNGIPHLILPVVTDAKKASIALNWAVNEMTRRYKIFADIVVRDMKSYNKKAEEGGFEKLPQIVVIIDELADLMMIAPNQVEDAICRLAQMARAAGIHLIVATQRPSVDVITGLIKANIPSRIAFSVSSAIDSRTIIDMGGAEKLLGKGDMLYYPVGASKPKRAQGAFMSDEEVEALVGFIKNQAIDVKYNEEILDDVQSYNMPSDDVDEHLDDAINFVVESGQASASLLQRRFRVGYNRAARLIDSMEERGIIGQPRGSKPREVLMTMAELQGLKNEPADHLMNDAADIEGINE